MFSTHIQVYVIYHFILQNPLKTSKFRHIPCTVIIPTLKMFLVNANKNEINCYKVVDILQKLWYDRFREITRTPE